jgi:hypothetical protein
MKPGSRNGATFRHGWLDSDATLTLEGQAARDRVEQQTDTAAASPWNHLAVRHTDLLAQLISPLTKAVRLAGIIPVSKPIGLHRGRPKWGLRHESKVRLFAAFASVWSGSSRALNAATDGFRLAQH